MATALEAIYHAVWGVNWLRHTCARSECVKSSPADDWSAPINTIISRENSVWCSCDRWVRAAHTQSRISKRQIRFMNSESWFWNQTARILECKFCSSPASICSCSTGSDNDGWEKFYTRSKFDWHPPGNSWPFTCCGDPDKRNIIDRISCGRFGGGSQVTLAAQ